MQSSSLLTHLAVAVAVTLIPLSSAVAGEAQEPVIQTPEPSSGWEYRTELYGWFTGLKGTTGPENFTTDVDDSANDILKNLKMAAALQFEARNGQWGFIADGFYSCLETSGTPPGPRFDHVSIDMKQFLGELMVAYRVQESTQGFFDLYGGIRYNYLSMDFSDVSNQPKRQLLPEQVSASKHWVDPVIGIRGQWNMTEKWFLAGKADIGGFGVGSDLAYTLQATVGYNFTEMISAELGYRYASTDYIDSSFVYDMAQAGIYTGIIFKF
jgi:opacity protein-like surface antigen